jgi:hypothetical protein
MKKLLTLWRNWKKLWDFIDGRTNYLKFDK